MTMNLDMVICLLTLCPSKERCHRQAPSIRRLSRATGFMGFLTAASPSREDASDVLAWGALFSAPPTACRRPSCPA